MIHCHVAGGSVSRMTPVGRTTARRGGPGPARGGGGGVGGTGPYSLATSNFRRWPDRPGRCRGLGSLGSIEKRQSRYRCRGLFFFFPPYLYFFIFVSFFFALVSGRVFSVGGGILFNSFDVSCPLIVAPKESIELATSHFWRKRLYVRPQSGPTGCHCRPVGRRGPTRRPDGFESFLTVFPHIRRN